MRPQSEANNTLSSENIVASIPLILHNNNNLNTETFQEIVKVFCVYQFCFHCSVQICISYNTLERIPVTHRSIVKDSPLTKLSYCPSGRSLIFTTLYTTVSHSALNGLWRWKKVGDRDAKRRGKVPLRLHDIWYWGDWHCGHLVIKTFRPQTK